MWCSFCRLRDITGAQSGCRSNRIRTGRKMEWVGLMGELQRSEASAWEMAGEASERLDRGQPRGEKADDCLLKDI